MAVQSALALLVSALLFGGMTLFSFGFAAFLFGNLAAAEAGRLLRRAFPPFYLWVIATAALGALLHLNLDHRNLAVLALVALSTLPARQLLMPAINAATDAGNTRRFRTLHGVSVALGVAQIALAGWVVASYA